MTTVCLQIKTGSIERSSDIFSDCENYSYKTKFTGITQQPIDWQKFTISPYTDSKKIYSFIILSQIDQKSRF